jgi:hypothetical protein
MGRRLRTGAQGPCSATRQCAAGQQWSANVCGYYEFWAQNRLKGYTLFATLNIPLGGVKK